MRKICDKKEKIHKEGQKVCLNRGGQAGWGWQEGPGGSGELAGSGGPPERGGVPNGVPGGSVDPAGKGGRAGAARAARSETQGQHESSGGCARRNGGSARLGRGPLLWAQKCPS